MHVRSLGYRTDLIFARFNGTVTDRGDYLVIRNPDNPTFHWGNFLLFAQPPAEGDLGDWRALFATEIGAYPHVRHLTFGIDTVDGMAGHSAPFLEAGFYCDKSIILTAQAVHRPPKCNDQVVVRRLTSEAEWDAALALNILCFRGEHSEPGYSIFARRQQDQHRAMVDAGLGHWFGAFDGSHLTAALGLFQDADTQHGAIGRFQSVVTDPAFRRRGICGRLVYAAAAYGLTEMGIKTLVMAADEEYHAANIYESVGFRPTEYQVGLSWWDRSPEAG